MFEYRWCFAENEGTFDLRHRAFLDMLKTTRNAMKLIVLETSVHLQQTWKKTNLFPMNQRARVTKKISFSREQISVSFYWTQTRQETKKTVFPHLKLIVFLYFIRPPIWDLKEQKKNKKKKNFVFPRVERRKSNVDFLFQVSMSRKNLVRTNFLLIIQWLWNRTGHDEEKVRFEIETFSFVFSLAEFESFLIDWLIFLLFLNSVSGRRSRVNNEEPKSSGKNISSSGKSKANEKWKCSTIRQKKIDVVCIAVCLFCCFSFIHLSWMVLSF